MAHYSQWHAKEKAWVSSLHDAANPPWFGLIDFKVLLLKKQEEPRKHGKSRATSCPLYSRNARPQKDGKGSLAVLLLAERAHSEGARSTRAFEDRPGRPVKRKASELEIICNRSVPRLMRAVKGNLVTLLREYRESTKKNRSTRRRAVRLQDLALNGSSFLVLTE